MTVDERLLPVLKAVDAVDVRWEPESCENSVDYVEREAKGMAGCELYLIRGLDIDWIGCSNLQIRVPRGCAPSD